MKNQSKVRCRNVQLSARQVRQRAGEEGAGARRRPGQGPRGEQVAHGSPHGRRGERVHGPLSHSGDGRIEHFDGPPFETERPKRSVEIIAIIRENVDILMSILLKSLKFINMLIKNW